MSRPYASAMRLISGIGVFTLLAALTMGLAPRRPKVITFPKNFLWGSATAAHQVEGGNYNNDWYEWELAGKTRDKAGLADDHYNRYENDFALAQSMHHNAYRMSVEWSRLEPKQGVFNWDEVAHYRAVLESAHAHGLKTFVTLHHFTNPIWAAHQGGWLNDQMPFWFAAYVAFVVPNIGDLVDYWVTVNEPNVTTLTGYVVGLTPPGKTDPKLAIHALANLIKAHAKAYHLIHAFYPDAKVGFAHHMRVFEANTWWNPGDQLLKLFIDDYWNNQIPKAMKTGHLYLNIPFLASWDEHSEELENTLDWIGVNYYTRDFLKLDLSKPQKFEIVTKEDAPHNDLGWEIYPEGFYKSLMRAASFGVPVYVTENGIADAQDKQRRKFLCDHLTQMSYAIDDGADVRGYLHWSLMDNWEWIDGFMPRFGLMAVDYATQTRTIRPSAEVLTHAAATNDLAICK